MLLEYDLGTFRTFWDLRGYIAIIRDFTIDGGLGTDDLIPFLLTRYSFLFYLLFTLLHVLLLGGFTFSTFVFKGFFVTFAFFDLSLL